jgi:hypothetical protein
MIPLGLLIFKKNEQLSQTFYEGFGNLLPNS